MSVEGDWRRTFDALSLAEQERIVASLPAHVAARWGAEWAAWAHEGQVAPAGDWRTWVIMGGRGFGKTRAGAEFLLNEVREWGHDDRPAASLRLDAGAPPPPQSGGGSGALRVALVAATLEEARAIMVEGPSGLLALARPGEVARWSAGERRLHFANGAVAELFSGRSPQQLRGPEHDLAWCDELGKWAHADATWDMLQFGLRRGERPRCVVTTTPSDAPALARVLAAAGTVLTGGATRANRHLAPGFVTAVEAAYAGTRLAAQEIEGLLPVDREGSLWPAALVARCRGVAPVLQPGGAVTGVNPVTSDRLAAQPAGRPCPSQLQHVAAAVQAAADRADAMVWALWALCLARRGDPGVRWPV